jgi:hypothetical protein
MSCDLALDGAPRGVRFEFATEGGAAALSGDFNPRTLVVGIALLAIMEC